MNFLLENDSLFENFCLELLNAVKEIFSLNRAPYASSFPAYLGLLQSSDLKAYPKSFGIRGKKEIV